MPPSSFYPVCNWFFSREIGFDFCHEKAVSHLLGLPKGSRIFEEDVLCVFPLGPFALQPASTMGSLIVSMPCGPFHSLITVINVEHLLCATASGLSQRGAIGTRRGGKGSNQAWHHTNCFHIGYSFWSSQRTLLSGWCHLHFADESQAWFHTATTRNR